MKASGRQHRRVKTAVQSRRPGAFRVAMLGAVLTSIILQAGCSGPTTPANHVPSQTVRHVLSPTEAAQLAAKLANDECERLYRKRPFTANQHLAVLQGDQYRWGGLNEGGRGGLSALVVFRSDGSHPKAEVYFSTDFAR
jgi:hypothetical protein